MAENGNGDLKALIKLKAEYRASAAEINAEIAELQASKKMVREAYIEKAVDIADQVFPENIEEAPAPTPTPEAEAKPDVTRCPNCDAAVGPNAKFCSECAYPLKDEAKIDEEIPNPGPLVLRVAREAVAGLLGDDSR